MIPNSLVRQSLAIEQIIDREKILRSHGGTPRRVLPGKYFGEAQKIRTINHRKVAQTPLCMSASKQGEDISIDDSNQILPTTVQQRPKRSNYEKKTASPTKSSLAKKLSKNNKVHSVTSKEELYTNIENKQQTPLTPSEVPQVLAFKNQSIESE